VEASDMTEIAKRSDVAPEHNGLNINLGLLSIAMSLLIL
jgi:hypothetical protein